MSQEFHGYNPLVVEPKWQKYWDENKSFATTEDPGKKNSMHSICSLIHPAQAFM